MKALVFAFLVFCALAVRVKKMKKEPVDDVPTTGLLLTTPDTHEGSKDCGCHCKDQQDPTAQCPEGYGIMSDPYVNPSGDKDFPCCPTGNFMHDGTCKGDIIKPVCPEGLDLFQGVCRPLCECGYNKDELSCEVCCPKFYFACNGHCIKEGTHCEDSLPQVDVCQLATYKVDTLKYTLCEDHEFVKDEQCYTKDIASEEKAFTFCYTKRPYHLCASNQIQLEEGCFDRCWGPAAIFDKNCFNKCPEGMVRCGGHCVQPISNVVDASCHTLEQKIVGTAIAQGTVRLC